MSRPRGGAGRYPSPGSASSIPLWYPPPVFLSGIPLRVAQVGPAGGGWAYECALVEVKGPGDSFQGRLGQLLWQRDLRQAGINARLCRFVEAAAEVDDADAEAEAGVEAGVEAEAEAGAGAGAEVKAAARAKRGARSSSSAGLRAGHAAIGGSGGWTAPRIGLAPGNQARGSQARGSQARGSGRSQARVSSQARGASRPAAAEPASATVARAVRPPKRSAADDEADFA